jgi:hypothetical protein
LSVWGPTMFNRSTLEHLGKFLAREVVIVGVAACAIVLCYRAATGLFQLAPATPPVVHKQMVGPLVAVGTAVKLSSTDFGHHSVSLVMVSSPSCPYCLQSEAFHRRLFAEAARVHIPFYVVVPEQREAAGYLKSAGLDAATVREWKDLGGRVPGTPTIISVDSSGVARRLWVGRLPAEVEADLLESLSKPPNLNSLGSSSGGSRRSPNYSSADELRRRALFAKMQIIDIHERGEEARHSDTITVPLIEISTRARFELDRASLQVVDCSNLSDVKCGSAVGILSNLGFQVATIGAGSLYESCDVAPVK